MAKFKFTVHSYEDCVKQLGNKSAKKMAYATYLIRTSEDAIAVKYHGTKVITYKPSGEMYIDYSIWKTKTTKERVNKNLPQNMGISSDYLFYFNRVEVFVGNMNYIHITTKENFSLVRRVSNSVVACIWAGEE